jgi:hypothetical protein
VLDDERREAFLNALQSLEDEKEEMKQREIDLEREREEAMQRQEEEERRQRIENEERERARLEEQRSIRDAAESEVDFGVDDSHPGRSAGAGSVSGSAKGSTSGRRPKKSAVSKKPRNKTEHKARPSAGGKKAVVVQQQGVMYKASVILGNLQRIILALAQNFKTNPMFLLRTLAFVIALLLALSNRAIKERLRRLLGCSWNKVAATGKMATKVSYI